jgi:hypoxanthine phosphoribosyltransferase
MDYKKELLIPREVIAERIKELAEAIEEEYRGKELILIGILKGAVFFLTDLARELSLPIKLDFIRVASYGSGMEPGSISLTKDVELSV